MTTKTIDNIPTNLSDEYKSSFRRLVELTDKAIREQFEEEKIYYINESRMDNLLGCLERGAKTIKTLEAQIKKLESDLQIVEDRLFEALMYETS